MHNLEFRVESSATGKPQLCVTRDLGNGDLDHLVIYPEEAHEILYEANLLQKK